MERQAIDYKEKPRVRSRPEEEKALLRKIADGTAEGATERQIVKTKRFAIEPMFEEDAVAAMEDLGHDFYVFVNAENERVAVLYRRKDGHYGLIEPVVGGDYTPKAGRAAEARSLPQRAGDGRRGSGRGTRRRYRPASRSTYRSSTRYRRSAATSGWNSASRWLTSFSG